MDAFTLFKCPQFLDNAIAPPAKEIGTTLGNIFYLVFSPINYNVEKLRHKHAENLKKYEESIEAALSKIPEDKLIEPKLEIVGPIMDASKFYIENEELRNMFSRLLAASLNSDYINIIHPSFVDIIKQLSPQDASNLQVISVNNLLPVAAIQWNAKDRGYIQVLTHLFISNPSYTDLGSQASSISNLCRLGLIEAQYTPLKDDVRYNDFETHPEYLELKTEFENEIQSNPEFPYATIQLVKGGIKKTPFGEDFIKVCITENSI